VFIFRFQLHTLHTIHMFPFQNVLDTSSDFWCCCVRAPAREKHINLPLCNDIFHTGELCWFANHWLLEWLTLGDAAIPTNDSLPVMEAPVIWPISPDKFGADPSDSWGQLLVAAVLTNWNDASTANGPLCITRSLNVLSASGVSVYRF